MEVMELLHKVSMLTGLHIAVENSTIMSVYQDGERRQFGAFHSEEALETALWEIAYRQAKRQLALARVKEALVEGRDWIDLFTIAVEDYGWDPLELAEESGVPRAVNVRIVE